MGETKNTRKELMTPDMFADYILHDLFRHWREDDIKKHERSVVHAVTKYGKRVVIDALMATKDKRHSGEPAHDEMAYFLAIIRRIGNEKGFGK
jgi:hypothetical protein